MKARFVVALAVLGVSPNAFGQEDEGSAEASAEASTEVSTEKSAEAPAAAAGPIDTFAAPNGQYGAGLSISGVKTARWYGELGFFSISPGPMSIWSFSAIAGGGYKLMENIELEGMLPLSFFSMSGGTSDETGFAVGNLHLGAYLVGTKDALRDKVVLGADAAVGLHIPTGDGDMEVSLQIDPGVGFWASNTVLVGGRVPVAWIPTSEGDNAQIAIEPYTRIDFGSAYFNARFTVNIDEPLGFAFDEGKIWALHLGFGGAI